MPGFRRTAAGIAIKLDRSDARILATLASQVAELLADRDDSNDDPVLARLLPDGYRNSPADTAEFRRFTENELADDKVRSAVGMAELLSRDTEGDPETPVRVVLDDATAFDWMRSLTDIRLALATRLGIVDEESPIIVTDETEFTLAIYNWLGSLQWSLVSAVARGSRPGRSK